MFAARHAVGSWVILDGVALPVGFVYFGPWRFMVDPRRLEDMKQFRVIATFTEVLETYVEADSLEEAQSLIGSFEDSDQWSLFAYGCDDIEFREVEA